MTPRSSGAWGVVPLVLIALAWGCLMQQPGPNQNVHLALLYSLADGTPRIDEFRTWSRDIAWIDGHFYAAKAPGLDLLTFPWFAVLRATGLEADASPPDQPWPEAESQMPLEAVWQVGLVGATLPALLLLLLVRRVVERFVPGYGTLAAATVGAGSIVGVLATMYFAHALSALLGFAAFAVLAGRGPPSGRRALAAGALAGLAVTVEFPLAIVAVLVGLFAVRRAPRLRPGFAYAAGAIAGLSPLLAFNTWAFGSPTRLSYTNAVLEPGASGHDVVGANASGLFGVGVPSPHAAVELLLSAKGLFVLSPVWALGAVGVVLLWRRGDRAEAALAGGVAGAFLLYDCAYWLPFGGFQGGPRLLVPAIPFLALPLAVVWRRLPLTSVALMLASVVITTASLIGGPLHVSEDAGTWFRRLQSGGADRTGSISVTVLERLWQGSPVTQALLVGAVALSAVLAALVVSPWPRWDRRDALVALAALVVWRCVYIGAPILFRIDERDDGWTGGLAAALVLAVSIWSLVLLSRGVLLALVPLAMVVPIVWASVAARPLLVAAAAAGALAAAGVVGGLRPVGAASGPRGAPG